MNFIWLLIFAYIVNLLFANDNNKKQTEDLKIQDLKFENLKEVSLYDEVKKQVFNIYGNRCLLCDSNKKESYRL